MLSGDSRRLDFGSGCWLGADKSIRPMLRVAADENLNGDIVRGILRRNPENRHRSGTGRKLSGADDLTILEWAAREGRVVVSHDISTLAGYAFEVSELIFLRSHNGWTFISCAR